MDKEKVIDYEVDDPGETRGDETPQPLQETIDAHQRLNNDLARYGVDDFISKDESEEEKKFDKVIKSNNVKQWIFWGLTAVIVILAILDIAFGIGKLDKWVYLFGVLTAYEANESREQNIITKEYRDTRRRARNIVKSVLRFKDSV